MMKQTLELKIETIQKILLFSLDKERCKKG